jgi:NAD(P)-dependent dehydrogenase (short-subunit alcohol dehydrogenase family)
MVFRVAITGGARGIGRATAEACLREGMSVVIGDIDAAELGPIARLVAGSPPAVADRIKRALGAGEVMARADLGARAEYRRRVDAEVKESRP